MFEVGKKSPNSALLYIILAVGYTQKHSKAETERKRTRERKKRRDSGRSRLPQRLLLQRESNREYYDYSSSSRMGFWGTTFAFCVLEGACAVYINATGIRGANHLKHLLSVTAVTCMWMMWAIIYMAQMYPLVQPVRNKGE